MAILLVVLSLLIAGLPLVVGWHFLVAVRSSWSVPTHTTQAPEVETRNQRWNSLQTGYFWTSVALLGVALLVSLLVGWLLYRWLFFDLFRLRIQMRQAVPGLLTPLQEEQGHVAHEPMVGLQQDVHQLVDKLREQQQNEVFKEQVDRWQDVARRLAHEIRNPLTPILLTVQELHKQYKHQDDRYKKLLEASVSIVEEEIDSLRRIVDEFSDFAKLPQVRLEPLDLNLIVTEFLDAYHYFRDSVEIRVELHHQPLWASVDRMLFKRVLHNLVKNAIEAGSPLVVMRTGSLSTREILCQIEDKGPGIPEHLQSKIFTPYFTTKQMGTGLGLSITKKIIIDHGGAITVSANPDRGSTFTIRLPALLPPKESKTDHA